jgi:long-subunit acyl-CoA synthetase (AMP-forming)
MDVTPFLEVKPAPRVVFDRLPERQSRARYMVPTPEGDWTVVTWAAHAQKIEELSLFLLSQGQKSGERGVVFGPNSVDWIASALAIQAAGGVMVPVYPASTPAQAAYIVEHSDARFLFVSGESALERVLSSFESYAKVERIVVLEDALDPSQVVKKLHAAGQKVPSFADHALHQRHHRPSQGRAADPPQRRHQHSDWLKNNAAAPRRRGDRSALAADEPHLRLRRGQPRQHLGLHHVPDHPARCPKLKEVRPASS